MTTLTVQVLPVSDTRPEIEVIGDKMTWMVFHDYFGSDLPQALRIEEVLDQTQEELREGNLLVACSVKTTEVIRARLPDREKIVTIPRSSAILFTLLPRDGDEGSLLGQKWEGIFNVSELIRVEPLPPAAKVMVDCTDHNKKKVAEGLILFNLTTFSTKVLKKRGIKGVSSMRVTYRFTEGENATFSTKQLHTRCSLNDIYDIFEGPVRARVFSDMDSGHNVNHNEVVLLEEKTEETFLVVKRVDRVEAVGDPIAVPLGHSSVQVAAVRIKDFQMSKVVEQKSLLKKQSSSNILQERSSNAYIDSPINTNVRDEPLYDAIRRLSLQSGPASRSQSMESVVSNVCEEISAMSSIIHYYNLMEAFRNVPIPNAGVPRRASSSGGYDYARFNDVVGGLRSSRQAGNEGEEDNECFEGNGEIGEECEYVECTAPGQPQAPHRTPGSSPHTAHRTQGSSSHTAHRTQGSSPHTAHRTQGSSPHTAHRTQGSSPHTAHRTQGSSPHTAHRTQTSSSHTVRRSHGYMNVARQSENAVTQLSRVPEGTEGGEENHDVKSKSLQRPAPKPQVKPKPKNPSSPKVMRRVGTSVDVRNSPINYNTSTTPTGSDITITPSTGSDVTLPTGIGVSVAMPTEEGASTTTPIRRARFNTISHGVTTPPISLEELKKSKVFQEAPSSSPPPTSQQKCPTVPSPSLPQHAPGSPSPKRGVYPSKPLPLPPGKHPLIPLGNQPSPQCSSQEESSSYTSATPTSLQLLHHVAGRVGRQWRTIGASLGLEEPCLDEADYKGNTLKEKCYQSLLLWLQGEGKDPKSWSVVLNALKKSGFTAVAMEIEGHFRAGTLDSDEL